MVNEIATLLANHAAPGPWYIDHQFTGVVIPKSLQWVYDIVVGDDPDKTVPQIMSVLNCVDIQQYKEPFDSRELFDNPSAASVYDLYKNSDDRNTLTKLLETRQPLYTLFSGDEYLTNLWDLYKGSNEGVVKVCAVVLALSYRLLLLWKEVAPDKILDITEPILTPVDPPTAIAGLVYTGNSLTGVAQGTGYQVSNGTKTNAGSYTATATLTSTSTSKWSDGTTTAKSIPWSIAKATNTWTTDPAISSSSWMAGGTAGTLTAGVTQYGTPTAQITSNGGGSWSTYSGTLPTAVGSYTIRYTSAATSNWTAPSPSVKSVSFTITQAVITVIIPTATTGLVYDGTSKTGVASGTGYTVSNGSASNAGSYTATATLASGSYQWSDGTTTAKSISWSIAQAANTWTTMPSITKSSWASDESAGVLTAGATQYGTPTATISKDGGAASTFSGTLPTEAGSYVITYTSAATSNWTAPSTASQTVSFAITTPVVSTPTIFKVKNVTGTSLDTKLVVFAMTLDGGETDGQATTVDWGDETTTTYTKADYADLETLDGLTDSTYDNYRETYRAILASHTYPAAATSYTITISDTISWFGFNHPDSQKLYVASGVTMSSIPNDVPPVWSGTAGVKPYEITQWGSKITSTQSTFLVTGNYQSTYGKQSITGQIPDWPPNLVDCSYTYAVLFTSSTTNSWPSASIATTKYLMGSTIPSWPSTVTTCNGTYAQQRYIGKSAPSYSVVTAPQFGSGVVSCKSTYYRVDFYLKAFNGWGSSVQAADACFSSCTQLASSVPSWPSTLVSCHYTYYACTSLTGNIPLWPANTKYASGTFMLCSALSGTVGSTDAELMPDHITSHTSCVQDCDSSIRSKFFYSWGGTRAAS